ncbi:MAG: hypothetical protein C5B59_09130 [Bacteroidetes bacterium]|nr:MAG: hypothetical protein C5B59_09130 [Bacteroidota bacterium]
MTKEQTVTIQNKQADFRTKFQTIREDENLLPFQKREELKALRSNEKESVRSVLTPDQATKIRFDTAKFIRGKIARLLSFTSRKKSRVPPAFFLES